MKLLTYTFSNGVIAPHESLITAFLFVAFLEMRELKIDANCSSIIAYLSRILKYLSPPWPVR
jgi:hypothetical protein